MANEIFAATKNLQASIQLINSVDASKFPLLLARISQKLHLRDERAFTEDEEEKLQHTFGLEHEQLDRVITTCEFIFHQAAYNSLKPKVLEDHMGKLDMDANKASAFVETWSSTGKEVVEHLRKRAIVPKQLEGINWKLNLQIAQSNQSRLKEPNAQFEFTLNNGDSEEKEKVQVEFTHEELYSFYNKLETIQTQLDSLS